MSERFEEQPAVAEAVTRMLTVFRGHRRGDVIPWAALEAAAGFERYTRHWHAAFKRVRRDFMAETGVCLWPAGGNGGVRLLTTQEQLTERAAKRRRRAFRQLHRDERELAAVPDAELTDVQRVMKARQIAAAVSARRQVLRQLRFAHALSRPTSSGVPRPVAQPRFPQQLVYFLQDVQDGRIKIGMGFDVEARTRAIANQSGRELRCLGYVEGGRQAEAALHLRFRHLQLLGEWFTGAEDLLTYIRERATPMPDAAGV